MASLFILNPFFGTEFSPVRDGPQNYLFANRHGEIIDMLAGKLITLMATGETLLNCTLSYVALLTMHKLVVGLASAASNVICG
jgi:hypothetical protein